VDSDPDGDPLVVSAVNGVAAAVGNEITLASGALLTVNADGTFRYDPSSRIEDLDPGDSVSDSFTYTISDGRGGTDTTTATIYIDGTDSPQAASASSGFDNSLSTLVADDTDPEIFVFSLEALESGTSVEVTDFDGLQDIIRVEDVTDIGAPGGDLEDLQAAIDEVFEDGDNVVVVFENGADVTFAGAASGSGSISDITQLVEDPSKQIQIDVS